MIKKLPTIAILLLTIIYTPAQIPVIFKPTIKTLQVVADQRWMDMPIIELDNGIINIDFDDLTHETQRYAYKIVHCTANFQTSNDLFESDYIDGFAEGNLIDDIHESLNTNTLYTHYHFSIPNEKCSIKLSGNYRVTVYDENNEDAPVFKAYFMVVEPVMKMALQVTTNTEKSINKQHQQLGMNLYFNGLNITDWKREIQTIVIQNGRWDNAVVNPAPQYIKHDGLIWDHNTQLVFNGGNEYRKFEILDVNHANMGVRSLDWDNTEYHAYLWTDEPRTNYVYDEDANGAFFIRNSDNREINYTSEYQIVHFCLKIPPTNASIYLNGAWTYNQLTPEYQLSWNSNTQCYESKHLLKQGYYNYQYLMKHPSNQVDIIPSEGNFFQTENQYTVLVYYHGIGSRYDRLVCTASLRANSK